MLQKIFAGGGKSENTIEKYLRDVRAFAAYLSGIEVTKETVIAYKSRLLAENYAVRSINSILASVNSLFAFLGWTDCRAKSIMITWQNKEKKKDGSYC